MTTGLAKLIARITAFALLLCSIASADPSFDPRLKADTVPFYTGANYDPAIPKPNDFAKRPIGSWPVRYDELIAFIKAVQPLSKRMVVQQHGESHEQRALYNVILSSENNIARLEEIRKNHVEIMSLKRSGITASSFNSMPAVAWLGYSVHGDECSGTDAAMQLIYHFAAAADQPTLDLLEKLVIIIDPSLNPDGRERYLNMLSTYNGAMPNHNFDALQHNGVWPYGRTNHYWFDLNRDWTVLTQPETKGRIATFNAWAPQLVVDAHEMGPDDQFLFGPPREPINYHVPSNVRKWWPRFSKDQGSAFDKRGWPYYTGEWYEAWGPYYGDAQPTFSGSIGILYEMAGVDGQFVRQSDDYLLTYQEAVNKQFTSSLANLGSLAANKNEILADYYEARKEIVAEGSRTKLSFVFTPIADTVRLYRFIQALVGQAIEVRRTTSDATLASATDLYGRAVKGHRLPAGSFVVPTSQVQGALARAILEFDPKFNIAMLNEERREVEKFASTRLYDASTWSLPMAFGLDAYTTNSPIGAATDVVASLSATAGVVINPQATYAFIAPMQGEKTYRFLSAIMPHELVTMVSTKALTIDGRSFEAGSVLFRVRGNAANLADLLSQAANQSGLSVYGVNTGFSSQGSHLGAPTFRQLVKPSVAIVVGPGTNFYAAGTVWHTIDKELAYPNSLIELSDLRYGNLNAYNVIYLGTAWSSLSDQLGSSGVANLKSWMERGGTLILAASSAAWAADSSTGLSSVRPREQLLAKLSEINTHVKRERGAEAPVVDTLALWYPERAGKKSDEDKPIPSLEHLKDQNDYARRFSPQGAYLRVDLDPDHWLGFGAAKSLPVFYGTSDVFLTSSSVETAARFADVNSLRLSGLLWPEARERIANSAYLTRESIGSGQLILFAEEPNFRGHNYATRQLLLNAIFYGPGMTN